MYQVYTTKNQLVELFWENNRINSWNEQKCRINLFGYIVKINQHNLQFGLAHVPLSIISEDLHHPQEFILWKIVTLGKI